MKKKTKKYIQIKKDYYICFMENRELLKQILQLPLRRWIITDYGTFQDVHKICILWYDESEQMQQMYLHILKFYKDFKTKK